MFGVGPQEVVVIVLLLLVVFGPSKAISMARDLGRFVNEAREHVDEFKGELLDGGEDRDEPTSDSRADHKDEMGEQEKARELPQGEKAGLAETRLQK